MLPSCGAAGIPPASAAFVEPRPVSLLLLPLFALLSTGGDKVEGFPSPGIAGGTPIGGPAELVDSFPRIGADRSFVTVFLSLVPFVISVNKAPYIDISITLPSRADPECLAIIRMNLLDLYWRLVVP